MAHKNQQSCHYPEIGVPYFWPLGIAMNWGDKVLKLQKDNLNFLSEVVKTEVEKQKPKWATPNKILYELKTFILRDFSVKGDTDEIPTFILPPYAGHTSVIADFSKKQSLVETLLENGITRVLVTDWNTATPDMKDYNIDNYLAALHIAISDVGKKVNLIGLCQGGWLASMYAARFPDFVASLVLAGAPIDTQAGDGIIKKYANTLPFSFYEELVTTGNGLLKGTYMLESFKNMNPKEQYVDKYVELYENINDPDYLKRTENFAHWYEYTLNLPGKWYLQAIKELFKENNFVKGKFVGLGETLNPKTIKCPLYLLAGAQDDITPKEQVFNAEKYFGTPAKLVIKDLAKGGHIGLFMGTHALSDNWLNISKWLKNK